MSFVQELAIGIGAIIMILGSIAVIIAALWGKPRRRRNHTWDESIEDV